MVYNMNEEIEETETAEVETASVWSVQFDEIPEEYWLNVILMRLAAGVGLIEHGYKGDVEVDLDSLIEEVEERLYAWRDNRDG